MPTLLPRCRIGDHDGCPDMSDITTQACYCECHAYRSALCVSCASTGTVPAYDYDADGQRSEVTPEPCPECA